MLTSLKNILFSTRLMAILFVVFATALAMGTFIESWYSTETARIWIYNTRWFEAIMGLFIINFAGNIFRYRLFRWEKWPVLLLHLSWILIIIGAFVTRYISFEGRMPIREGATENVFYSDNTFLTAQVGSANNEDDMVRVFEDAIIVTPEAEKSSLPWNYDFKGEDFSITYEGFIEGAEVGLVPDAKGKGFLKIVESSGGSRHDHYLESGKTASIHNVLFSLNNPITGAINIMETDSVYVMIPSFEGSFMRMADQLQGRVVKDSVQNLQLRSLYQLAGMQFVIPDSIIKGKMDVVPLAPEAKTEASLDALILKITSGGETMEKKILGGPGSMNFSGDFQVGKLNFNIGYGSKVYQLPFAIKLNDFIAEKYPGTENSYSSFMSKITVEDERPFDYDIYMNHVLDHHGYRFFQSSYHPDEKGTILSVNHDAWGTGITYFGYTLLYIGLIGIMIFGKTRFKDVVRQLLKLKSKQATLVMAFFISIMAVAQDHDHQMAPTQVQLDSLLVQTMVSEAHAEAFGSLVIQDDNGRMKPINTYASELLRKLSFQDHYAEYNSDQVFLSMMQSPRLWYNIPFLALDKEGKNDSIRKIIGIEKEQEFASATDFFDSQGEYKLATYLQDAYGTNVPNKFQKDFRDMDLRLGLLNRALSGELVRIFPLLDDTNNKWISTREYNTGAFQIKDSMYANFVKNALPFYLSNVQKGIRSGDYTDANQMLDAFVKTQKNHGSEVLPSDKKIKAEIVYNKLNIFKKLFQYYALTGILLFFVLIARILKDREIWRIASYFFKGLIILFFVWHTLGLIGRWYISNHAPWSDAYESILYVAWAAMAIGLIFSKWMDLVTAACAFVAAILLWVAHMSWVDPAIANLVPVLDSYWLMIHVAIIVASYGPFSVGMMLGVISLILMLMTTKNNKERIEHAIKSLTYINELALTLGLVMLTIGNFLGGQWANESWGRYWGWDPKETWALISIMVYAFVVHARLVPGLRGKWTFNFMSIIAFASIMMTYFGVNFYLVGLHSYASGAQVITPDFIWYACAGVFVLGALSFWRYKLHFLKE